VIAAFVQKTPISDCLQHLESIMTILTPKELKYLILKLNTILSDSKKTQIIENAMKLDSKVIESCIYHFLTSDSSNNTDKQLIELKIQLKDQHFDLQR
jgi:hypothetical protein